MQPILLKFFGHAFRISFKVILQLMFGIIFKFFCDENIFLFLD